MEREYPPGVLKRVQQIELDMLAEFDRICRKHGLVYFADGGTCLGAVRHGGFIPWDDDIDIGMPIDDYRRFEELAASELPSDMSFHTPRNDPGMVTLWGKLCKEGTLFVEQDAWETGSRTGIFLDIIPYINLNESSDKGVAQLNKTENLAKLNYIYRITNPSVLEGKQHAAFLRVAWLTSRFFVRRITSTDKILQRFDRLCECHDPSCWWGNPAAAKPWPYHRDVLFDPIEMDFDGLTIFAPHDPDAYLKELYGDYMTLPAPEKRHTHTPYVLSFGDEETFDLRG